VGGDRPCRPGREPRAAILDALGSALVPLAVDQVRLVQIAQRPFDERGPRLLWLGGRDLGSPRLEQPNLDGQSDFTVFAPSPPKASRTRHPSTRASSVAPGGGTTGAGRAALQVPVGDVDRCGCDHVSETLPARTPAAGVRDAVTIAFPAQPVVERWTPPGGAGPPVRPALIAPPLRPRSPVRPRRLRSGAVPAGRPDDPSRPHPLAAAAPRAARAGPEPTASRANRSTGWPVVLRSTTPCREEAP